MWGQPRLSSLRGADWRELCRAQSEPGHDLQHQRVGHHHLTDCLPRCVRSSPGVCSVLHRDHGNCQQLELRLQLPPSKPRLQVEISWKVVLTLIFPSRVCVRREKSFCTITWSSTSFSVSASPLPLVPSAQTGDILCTYDWILFPG